ncbi:ESCRT-II subunit protein snf8 [Rhizophlyctis rosea]|uniref:Vacuolar-sorting protein SNF8 n=1 Tax=Rhizophlyctis rosea TaxID=64517 RepID=A0AAD5X106_9FUNG|nr:ESCRT-II subunit protein snf8 [Rhizophlyctis rosea]
MARRRAGIHGLQQQARHQEEFQKAGEALAAQQLEQLKNQLELFKTNLEDFARKYRKDIKRDPEFRKHFQRMCSNIGVDPLASNKGFWSELLGVGDFYYELGVQIAEICLATRERNGGLIEITELKTHLERMRGRNAQEISEDDILRSIKNLKPLGNGFDIITIGNRKLVQSVPRELNSDFSCVLDLAQRAGFVRISDLKAKLGWDTERASHTLDNLLKDGICWIDLQASEPEYWVSSFFGDS